MSLLANLEEEIRSATEAVARAERTAAAFPQYSSAFVTLRSVEKYRSRLIERFESEISRLKVTACSYRIEYPFEHNPAIAGVTSAIGIFQELYTTVYHALKNGVRQRAKVGQASIDATRLNFAFTFPGSVGFMMTLDRERELFSGSLVDRAMSNTLSLLTARSSEVLDKLVEETGLPSIRLTHRWAAENARYGFGANIRWTVEDTASVEARIQPAEVTQLSGILGQYIAKERVNIVATLEHVNMFDKTFEMSTSDKRIVGTFDRAITSANPALMPAQYIAHLTVATRIAAAGETEVTYFLDELEQFLPSSPSLQDPRFVETL